MIRWHKGWSCTIIHTPIMIPMKAAVSCFSKSDVRDEKKVESRNCSALNRLARTFVAKIIDAS
jgi:hypothetical protein